jgi:hypothetical protein
VTPKIARNTTQSSRIWRKHSPVWSGRIRFPSRLFWRRVYGKRRPKVSH